MRWSLNEVETLARKAVRGAGYSWGQAEDAGAAVRWLEARGWPGTESLSALLDAGAGPGDCPIELGTMLCDRGAPPAPLRVADLSAPLLVLPFRAWCAEACGAHLRADIGAAEFTVGPRGAWADGRTDLPLRGPLQLGMGQKPEAPPVAVADRSRCDAAAMAALERFAARTYAPATEHSRLAGAGAGLSDTD